MSKTNKYIIEASTKGFDKAKNKTKSLGASMGSLTKSVGGVALAYFGTQGLISAISGSISAFGRQEQAEKSLETALGRTSRSLLDQASALQQVTTFGDEATIEQMAFLGSLKFTEDQIKEIIPVAMDLASATGITLESAVRNISKTYSGLQGELGELIPQLRELTKEQMQSGEALNVISDLMGGTASENTKTMSGSISQLQNTFGDFGENIGKIFSDPLRVAIGVANNFLDAMNFIIDNTSDTTETFKGAVSTFDAFVIKVDKLSDSGGDLSVILNELSAEEAKLLEELKMLNTPVKEQETGFIDLESAISGYVDSFQDVNNQFNEFGNGISVLSEETAKYNQNLLTSGIEIDEFIKMQKKGIDLVTEDNSAREQAIQFQLSEIENKKLYIESLTEEGDKKYEAIEITELQIKKDNEYTTNVLGNLEKVKVQSIKDFAILVDGSNLVQSTLADMFNVETSGGDVLKKFILQLLDMMTGVVLASSAVNKALSGMWKGVFGVPQIIASLIALEGAKAVVRAVEFHKGGLIGSGGENVPIVAQQGEFVMQRSAVESIGVERLQEMNEGGGGGLTLNISAPLVDDTIVDTIIPAIETAYREGRA